jgi:hypothetical protein
MGEGRARPFTAQQVPERRDDDAGLFRFRRLPPDDWARDFERRRIAEGLAQMARNQSESDFDAEAEGRKVLATWRAKQAAEQDVRAEPISVGEIEAIVAGFAAWRGVPAPKIVRVAAVEGDGPMARDDSKKVEIIIGSSVQPRAIAWLWRDWLAHGKLHILAGRPGTLKTTGALGFAAAVSSGGVWPDGSPASAGTVVIWSGEDAVDDTLLPRIIAMGGDPANVAFISAWMRTERNAASTPRATSRNSPRSAPPSATSTSSSSTPWPPSRRATATRTPRPAATFSRSPIWLNGRRLRRSASIT